MPKGYVVTRVDILDPEAYAKYAAALAVREILAERDHLLIGGKSVVQRPIQGGDHANRRRSGGHVSGSA